MTEKREFDPEIHRRPTPEERANAQVHATAWDDAYAMFNTFITRHLETHDERRQANIIKMALLSVGSAYRKIANDGRVEL
ncbi:hypothetical protein [uncultured Alsobacter sp.]|uniref:hypothetical protein n=1 Tax=uncultured Alsobacter sp. TaxID=1748258 RepID=UPI0025F2B884|nr:hypothetical protein [uncultured Alsobacter sp.]